MPKYASEIYSPLGKYLGHFRNLKILEKGHNETDPKKLQKEEDERVLREAMEAAKRLEAAGFGKTEKKKPEPVTPAPEPKPTMKEKGKEIRKSIEEQVRARRRALGY